METKTVRLDEEVYERIKAHKRDDETFSEAIDRLTGGYSLLDFARESEGEPSLDVEETKGAMGTASEEAAVEARDDLGIA